MTESIKIEEGERVQSADLDMNLIRFLFISFMQAAIPRVCLEFRILSWVVIA